MSLRVGAVLAVLAATSLAVPLQMLSDPKARCMDGTFSGFYVHEGSESTRYIIHLQGGGECATESSCKSKLLSPLGSSKYFAKDFDGFGFYSLESCSDNPDMCNWTHVMVPYCSQDLHGGTRATPSGDSWGLYFAGRYVFDAVIHQLVEKHGLGSAEAIILSGDSAGGIGTWYHLDRLAERFPKARVVGAPVAGFYFPAYPYMGVNHTASALADFRPEAWPSHYALWNSTVDDSCKAAHPSDPWVCMLANGSLPYISSETFVAEAQTDEVVLTGHDWVPAVYVHNMPEQAYLAKWAANMTQALAPLMSSPHHGVFNPACFIHTNFYPDKPLLQGLNFLQVFGNWYFQRHGPTHLADSCGVMCNPTCP